MSGSAFFGCPSGAAPAPLRRRVAERLGANRATKRSWMPRRRLGIQVLTALPAVDLGLGLLLA